MHIGAEVARSAKAAVTYSDGIGDTLMSLPALRAIHQFFDSPVAFFGSEVSQAILAAEFPTSCFSPREALLSSRKKFDCWLSCDPGEGRQFTTMVLETLKPQTSVGWSAEHTYRIPPLSHLHLGDEVFLLSSYLTGERDINAFSVSPSIVATDRGFASDIRAMLPPSSKLAALHPQTIAPIKNLPLETFRRLLELFMADHLDVFVAVIGIQNSSLDRGSFSERIISFEGISLAATCALISRADVFIGIDSGMLHVADLCRIPSVGLFGPTSPQRWGCRFAPHIHLASSSKTIADIDAETIAQAVGDIWRELP